MNPVVLQIAEAVKAAGGRALLVGGYPRDIVMQRELGKRHVTKDMDVEVFGLADGELQKILATLGPVNAVGSSFGVYKLADIDVSLPRKDSKQGTGHRGFHVAADPNMTLKQAGQRRDFTINTLAIDPLTDELFDEHGAVADITSKVLRAVDPTLFGDDPLRVLRAMQFAGRFNFSVDPATAELCRAQDLTLLSSERIGEEWLKLMTKSERPSVGLTVARELGVIDQLHPQLSALVETPQEPEWHPEGSVWNHSLMAADKAAEIVRREGLAGDDALIVLFGALTHDFGKPAVTAVDPADNRIHSHNHAKAGQKPAKDFLNGLHIHHKIVTKICRIIYDHMFLPEAAKAKDPAIRRLARRLQPATIQELLWVTEADFFGRSLEHIDFELGDILRRRAAELAVTDHAMQPVVLGRHLIERGEVPGAHLGTVLKQLEAAQMNGHFTDLAGGLAFYDANIAGTRPEQHA